MLAEYTKRYLDDLTRAGSSAHTVDAYAADLREFLLHVLDIGAVRAEEHDQECALAGEGGKANGLPADGVGQGKVGR